MLWRIMMIMGIQFNFNEVKRLTGGNTQIKIKVS
jgi:hypothetical protein